MNDQSTTIIRGAEPFFLPGGPTGLLIVHGYGGTIDDYREAGAALNRAGYSVLGIRLAGHGQSREALRQSHLEDWLESIRDGIAKLRKECASVVIFGISFGGTLGLLTAAREPGTLNGIVTLNAPMRYRGGGLFQKIGLRVLRLATPYYQKPGMTPEIRERYTQSGSMTHWPIDGLLETYKIMEQDVPAALGQVTQPALIMAVDGDELVDARSADLIGRTIASRQKVVLHLPGSTHRPFRDQVLSDTITKKILNYLQQSFPL